MLSGVSRVRLWGPAATYYCDGSSPSGSSVHGLLPGKTTGVDFDALLQGIFPTQGSNLCFLQLLHCKQILYH